MEKSKRKRNVLIKSFILIVIAAIIYTSIWVIAKGVAPMGMPKLQDVESVNISYQGMEEQEITDPNQLKILLDSLDLLNYRLMGEAEGEPIVSVHCHLKNGKEIMIEANHTTLWWKGKSHPIKQKDVFVNVIEGIFFSQEPSVK